MFKYFVSFYGGRNCRGDFSDSAICNLIFVYFQCATDIGGEDVWAAVKKCYNSRRGDQILKHMGSLTHNLNPGVTFIPTVTIQGVSYCYSNTLRTFFAASFSQSTTSPNMLMNTNINIPFDFIHFCLHATYNFRAL